MAVAGLGQDGYVRIQKEVTWGTALTNSMTFLPILPGAEFTMEVSDIENKNIIASRLKQLPNQGRRNVKFKMSMNLHFTLVGAVMNLLLGASSDSNRTDSTYVHTFLTPITGQRVGKAFTMQVAFGGDTAVQFAGCVFNSIKISGDNQGQIILEMEGAAKLYTTGVARETSFSYPTAVPANFSMVNLNIDPADASAFDQVIYSFEFGIELGLDLEDFALGSAYMQNPVFNTIPSVMLKANVAADKQFREAAQAHTLYDHILTITSTQYAAGTTFSKVEVEIPKAKLSPSTSIPFDNDRLKMDVEFDCSFGGSTTGSGSTSVHAEVRVTDAVAAYA